MKTLLEQTEAIFRPDGLLEKLIENYEPRAGQLEMAMAIAGTLEGGKLVVEAETGIGKTLAYLIPAVLSRQKVVISTNTLNLQEQILSDAIPFIQRNIDPKLSALCVKGRQNYLCLYRWQQFSVHPQLELFAPGKTRGKITEWLEATTTGDRAELPWLEDSSALWREISATTGQCLGSKCPQDKTCFITELRRKAAAARILIVNHHLLFSDLALRSEGHGEVLPRYESVIFDEAHNIENVATSFFGFSCSHYQLLELVKDVKLAAAMLQEDRQVKIFQAADALQTSSELFTALFPAQTGRAPLTEFIDSCQEWEERSRAVSDRLSTLAATLLLFDTEGEAWQGLANRCENLHNRFIALAELLDIDLEEKYIRWYERRDKNIVLTASPIDIAAELNSILYPEVRSVIFTSGTLTVGGNFSYFCNRLGLDHDSETLSLSSPFDYRNRTLLYIPGHSRENRFPPPDDNGFP
ncbi:MAG: ATP-dependent DNA helicase, partial [Deltaproteobacteria bacterium]|nr:ATP-dependent DNA helicase [Deltaproteobacteria bacterium]